MPNVASAQSGSDGTIIAIIDGREVSVPDDVGNMDRVSIAEWEAAGGAIAPYVEPPEPIPQSVSARQFKLQLLAAGLLVQVEAFISSQGRAVQIAYESSGSFVRSEPMMQSGFAAMGFTDQQIDQFFVAAAKL